MSVCAKSANRKETLDEEHSRGGGAALATALLSVSSAAAAVPKLVGTVGPGFTITLTQGGKKVTKLKAGKYTFVINDKSSMHSYGLDGPRGFAKDFTSVSLHPQD